MFARGRALLGLRVALGDAGVAYGTDRASEAVLLGPLLCGKVALPALTASDLPVEAFLVKSGPSPNVWCF